MGNLKCDILYQKPRPIPSREQFEEAVRLYNSMTDEKSLHLDASTSGLVVELEVKQVEGKGRGIFAARDITKGEVPWTTSSAAMFYEAEDYRRFILGLEVGMACDVLQWAYAGEDDEDGLYVAVELNESAMCNDGGREGGNVGCYEEDPAMNCNDDHAHDYILRDMKKGEELLCIYAHFSDVSTWYHMGLEI